MLLKGPMEFGFETDLWTTERVVKLIEEKFGVRYYPDHVKKEEDPSQLFELLSLEA
jgi:hypothetical protein